MFRYNIKPKTFIHIPFHPSLSLSKIHPFHFPNCGDTSIVQYLYCDVAHTRPLPTPGLFPIFSFSHQKNTTRISCGVVAPSPANSLSSRWILHERYSFSYSFIRKLNTTSFNFFPFFVKEQIYVDANIINLIIPIIIYFSIQFRFSIKFKQFKELVIQIII